MSILSRNQIPCAAGRLGQLQPDMIQSVAPKSAFVIGHQYFSEGRVRILSADDVKISSEVGGASGLYQQTIRLTEGTLVAKCSCPSNERPICRHCVAALLEYNRQSAEPKPVKSKEVREDDPLIVDVTPQEPLRRKSEFVASPLGAGLREAMVFLDWFQIAVRALKAEEPLPPAPPLSPGETADWVATLKGFGEELRQGKEKWTALETELGDREAQLSVLARDLETASNTKDEALRMNHEMKLELEQDRERLRSLVEIEEQRDRLAESLKALTGDMRKKAEQVDQLVGQLAKMPVIKSANLNSRAG